MLRRLWLVFVLFLLAGCGGAVHLDPERPQVVASIYPYYEFAKQVAGDRAEVHLLVPPGAEAHDFEPSPKDIQLIGQADLFLYNGGGLEGWAEQAVRSAPAGLVSQAFFELVEEKRADDPHIWLDPVLAQVFVAEIAELLTAIDPEGAAVYAERAAAYAQELVALDQAFQQGLATACRREIVTSHEAFGYLADRYGLTEIPITGLSPEAEPSPRALQEIVEKAKGHRYIFMEPLGTPKLAEVVADETGAEVLTLHPLEGLSAEEVSAGATYLSVMQQNLENLTLALGCD